MSFDGSPIKADGCPMRLVTLPAWRNWASGDNSPLDFRGQDANGFFAVLDGFGLGSRTITWTILSPAGVRNAHTRRLILRTARF